MSVPLTPFEKRLLYGLLRLGAWVDRHQDALNSLAIGMLVVGMLGLIVGYWASL